MMEDPKVITRCTYYIMVARYLERCADHACKIAEKIIYMVSGQHVEIDCREETSKACFMGVKKIMIKEKTVLLSVHITAVVLRWQKAC